MDQVLCSELEYFLDEPRVPLMGQMKQRKGRVGGGLGHRLGRGMWRRDIVNVWFSQEVLQGWGALSKVCVYAIVVLEEGNELE